MHRGGKRRNLAEAGVRPQQNSVPCGKKSRGKALCGGV